MASVIFALLLRPPVLRQRPDSLLGPAPIQTLDLLPETSRTKLREESLLIYQPVYFRGLTSKISLSDSSTESRYMTLDKSLKTSVSLSLIFGSIHSMQSQFKKKSSYFVDNNKLTQSFIWKCKRCRIANTILEKNNTIGRLMLLNFRFYCKATITKTVQ